MPGAHPATAAHRHLDLDASATRIGKESDMVAVHRRRRAAAIAAAGALALVACGGGGDDETAAEQFEDVLGELEETGDTLEGETFGGEQAAETKEPELTPVELELPRETTYLGATWTVDEVSHMSAGVDELGIETTPAAVVGFTVANTGEGVHDLPMTAERLALLDGDDFAIPADPTSAGNGEVLVVGGRSSFEALFPLEAGITADDLADYTFRIGVEGNVPALVPLSGEMPPVHYPMPLDIPVTVDGDLIGGSGTLRAIEAEVLLDYGEERADEDTRILALTGEVHITDNGAGGTAYVNPDDLGISVDGIRVEQLDAETPPATADLPAGATASATWVFVIPAGGKAGVLHFGSDSPDDAKGAAFTFPELP
jgi:hypothetical protein